MLHVGIDPGLRGAIVGIKADGSLGLVWDMPRDTTGIDFGKLATMMHELKENGIKSLHIEAPFYKTTDRTGVNGKRNMSLKNQLTARINSGVIMGMGLMIHRDTQFVQPSIWKKSIGVPTGSDKRVSIYMASDLFGRSSATKLTKDGRADAALIAYYGMRHSLLLERIIER